MREGTENGQQQPGRMVTMVKDRRGIQGEVGVGGGGWGTHEERAGRGG